MLGSPEISIVIPVYNEEESLPQLFKELYPVMENLQRSFEIIFINDGSRDKSFAMLYDFQKEHEKTDWLCGGRRSCPRRFSPRRVG